MNKYNARVTPITSLDVLSQHEVAQLCDMSQGGLHDLLHGCSLAVLNCGSEIDDGRVLLEEFKDYSIAIIQQERGIKLELKNAPSNAFVDGELIVGIKEHLFSVLRDIVYVK